MENNKLELIKTMLEDGKTNTEILMAVEDWTKKKYKDSAIRIGVKLLFWDTIQTMREDLTGAQNE